MKQLLALLLFVPSLCLAQLPDYVPLNDLVGWYPFDGNLFDMSGLGNDGSLHGASYGADYSGTPETALHCAPNGSPGWATLPDNGATESLDFSFSLWIEPEVTSGRSEVLSKDSYPQPGGDWSFFIEDGSFQFETGIDNQPTVFTEGGTTNPGEWHHIVVTRNGSESIISLYVDGEMVSATPESYGPLDSPNLIHVGRHAVLSNVYFQGMINDLGIWNRTLQPTEIQALFLAAPPEYGCTDSTACNFNPLANSNDGSCEYGCLYCGEGTVWDSTLAQCISIADTVFIEPEACAPSCGEGTVWDPVNEECIIAIPADLNYDGCVSVNDLLVLLAVHGTCPPYPEWPDEPTDTTWTCGDPLTYWDYDYATVLIGDQCWFAENLRTSSFSDGTMIPEEPDPGNWLALTTDARCHYDNVNSNAESFGTLYNWFAVTSAGGLCPNDWHVPGDSEWMVLEQVLGIPENQLGNVGWRGEAELAGIKLRASTSDLPGWNGSNEIGFSALPGGWRTEMGQFLNMDQGGYWWTSSNIESNRPCRGVLEGFSGIDRYLAHPAFGFSVRCVKD